MSQIGNKGRPMREALFDASFGSPPPKHTFYHQIKFRIINHNTRPTQNSQLRIAVKGKPNEAKLRWYWQGTDDSGKAIEKYVEQMHLENESPHTAILGIKADPEARDIEVPDASMPNLLYVPLGVKFNLKVSVVGLNHKRRDEFYTIELHDQETLHIEKSRSAL